VLDSFVCGPRIKFCALAQTWVMTQSLVSEKRSDWLTPWRVTMFVPSRGTHYNQQINNAINLLARPPLRKTPNRQRRNAAVAAIGVVRLERGRSLSHEDQGRRRRGGRSSSPVMAAARHFPSPSPSPSPSPPPCRRLHLLSSRLCLHRNLCLSTPHNLLSAGAFLPVCLCLMACYRVASWCAASALHRLS
jgi:hypothetical protein